MEQIHERVAGLDVHRDSISVCARVPGRRASVLVEKARFSTTTTGLGELAEWLAGRKVTVVGMEATGVYWKAPYYTLEKRFEVWLCNAQHVQNVPGRKTDLSDAEWLADVVAHGMVRASFVPPPLIRELRDLTRYRKRQVDGRAAEIQRLEKVLQDAGIKLSSVASEVLSTSGRHMIEALIAGQKDPATLAQMAIGRMRNKLPQLADALNGHFGAHHAAVAREILDHIDFLDARIAVISEQVAVRVLPFEAIMKRLMDVPGISRITAEILIAETGADMSRFPTPAHLASWAGLAPAITSRPGNANVWAPGPAIAGCAVC